MTTDRWLEVKDILLATLEADPAARGALLDERCADDPTLRAEVERHLANEGLAERLIDQPAVDLLAAPPPEGREGLVLGAFRLERELGRGGMGVVYLARRQDTFDQDVAIKILKRGLDTEEIIRRFALERRILSRLDHPNIARILDGGTTPDGLPYLAMEHVDGEPIDEYCREHSLTVEDRLRLFLDVCAAVHHAHQNLIVHRDLKPANLMVDRAGRPRLLDFGIAKLLDSDTSETRTSLRPMTPIWSSPEQRTGAAVTTASDIYSLGRLLDFLLTDLPQEVPSSGSEVAASARPSAPSVRLMQAAATAESADARRHFERRARRLLGDLDRIIAQAMHVEPRRRYASAADLAEDLERHLAGLPVRAVPDSLGYRLSRLAKRHPWGVALSFASLIGLVIFAVTVSLLLARTTLERDRAEDFRTIAMDAIDAADPSHPDSSSAQQLAKLENLAPRTALLPPADRGPLLNRLAQSFLRLGRSDLAISLLRQSVAAHEALASPSAYEYANALNNLGKALIDEGQKEEGLDRVQKAIETLAADAERYPRTLLEYKTNLAYGLEQQDPAAAESLNREVLAKRIELFGPNHLSVGDASNNLGFILSIRRGYGEAVPLLDEAVRIRQMHLGRTHRKVARSYSNRAAARLEIGDVDGAVEDAREALAIRVFLRASGSVTARVRLADALLSRDRASDTDEALKQLELAAAATKAESQTRIVIDRHTAHAWTRQGRATDAERLARETLGRLRNALGDSTWRLPDLESVLGGAVLAQGRRAQARHLLEAGWRGLCDDPGARVSARRQAVGRLRALDPTADADLEACTGPRSPQPTTHSQEGDP